MDDDDDGEEEELRDWPLPDDLTTMILLRVPAKDLIRYKLVCKRALYLISSPDFMSAQIKFSISDPSRNHLLLFHMDPIYIGPDYSPPRPVRSVLYLVAPHVVVVGAANGLLCVVRKSRARVVINDDIWILNPVTGHIMKLPVPSGSPRDRGTGFYDYRAGNGYFMFWWDSIAAHGDGEYKLVKIVPEWSDPLVPVSISITLASVWVSSSPETWSEIPVGFDGSFHHPSQSQYASGCDVVIGDFAYWIVFKNNRRDLHVLSLNLKTIALSLYEIPFPVHESRYSSPDSIYEMLCHRSNSVLFAANWKGQFALVERTDHIYDVYTMDAVEGWSVKDSPTFLAARWIKDVNGKAVVTIGVHSDRCGIVGICDMEYGIALYDVGTGEVEVIEDFLSGEAVASAYDFVGSFASIKGFKPIENADNIRVFWPDPSASRNNGNTDL